MLTTIDLSNSLIFNPPINAQGSFDIKGHSSEIEDMEVVSALIE